MRDIFLGWFVWGLILAAPVWWLAWRLRLRYWLPRMRSVMRRRKVNLPAQLTGLVILGKPRSGSGEVKA